jgi:hypothetical protein
MREPFIKGTICLVKGTKKQVKILGQVKAKPTGFIYEVEHLAKAEKDDKKQFRGEELQVNTTSFGKR